VPRLFGYDPCSCHGDRFPHRHGFPAKGSDTHFEPIHLDGQHFPYHGSRPTFSNGEVQKIVKATFGRMVKCWITKVYLTNPTTEPLTFSRPM
jgi:hypothetical protein